MEMRFLRLLLFLCLAVVTGPFTGCAKNYVTKRRQFKLISEKTEIEIGRKAKEEIIKEYGSVKDLEWQIYLDQVGQRIAKASDRSNLQYDFTIVNSEELNAFAVPGGFVFVTRGLLHEMADEAELAIVLGHEITHVAAWHGIEMLQKAGLLSTLTALGAVGGIAMGAGEAAIALAQAASVYENLYLLGYGRKNEIEADRYGIYYAAKAGYDPEAALTFFPRLDKIEKEEEASQHISPYWRTHPTLTDRRARAARWIAEVERQAGVHQSLAYNRDKYLAMVAKLPHGEPTERGTIEGRRYTNTVFNLRLEVPPGWTMDNSRAASLVAFTGPVPEVRGNLQRHKLSREMGVQDFAKQISQSWGVREASVREAEYPAGHGQVWQYGSDYTRYRTLMLVRGSAGYTLICQIPADTYLQYIVDCEKIMRSLQIQ
jgi:predicted Zn-dependent protease